MLQLEVKFCDPAQKRIPAPDRSRGEIKIFDPSSTSQIHLWSKSQIVRLMATQLTAGRTSHADRLKPKIASQLI
ncbi:hypothetical protein Osc7112_0329 [Oscillatoria nigro-viridis PCC 7112]|uniref:Uncharacterized protein n=1 Tax=Phormidium nigroviride PCC 7112 TaxID=179408 RepID=K9VA25_9CYAN|nr:hypothetical protein Osc7112_0329 [Oscillatoria nigro-viridis PCC 7112]